MTYHIGGIEFRRRAARPDPLPAPEPEPAPADVPPWYPADEPSTPGAETVATTLRLPPVLHEMLGRVVNQSGQSMNSLIVAAIKFAMTEPGGVTLINERRRKITPQGEHGEQAWAAVALLLSYLGQEPPAVAAWPWTQQFPGVGGADDLVAAGAYTAAELDRFGGTPTADTLHG